MAAQTYTTEQFYEALAQARGIERVCLGCGGTGHKAYGSTSTWRGGVGGQQITSGVCDKCWGSGDADVTWPSHRALAIRDRRIAELEAEVKKLRAMYVDLETD